MTLGDTDDVNDLILGEHSGNWDLLLKMFPGKVDLVGDASTVQLDLHDVSFLLSKNLIPLKLNPSKCAYSLQNYLSAAQVVIIMIKQYGASIIT